MKWWSYGVNNIVNNVEIQELKNHVTLYRYCSSYVIADLSEYLLCIIYILFAWVFALNGSSDNRLKSIWSNEKKTLKKSCCVGSFEISGRVFTRSCAPYRVLPVNQLGEENSGWEYRIKKTKTAVIKFWKWPAYCFQNGLTMLLWSSPSINVSTITFTAENSVVFVGDQA